MRNIFLEKLYTKCDGETVPRRFSKISKLRISLDQYSQFLYRWFSLYAKLKTNEKLKLTCRSLAFISFKAFLKRRGLDLVSLSDFLDDF